MRSIPTYTAEGRACRSYSLEAVERLLALGSLTVKRNARTGSIVAAQFLPRLKRDPKPCSLSSVRGQKYCRQKRVSETCRAWAHKDLPTRDDLRHRMTEEEYESAQAVEMHVRSVFKEVQVSVFHAHA